MAISVTPTAPKGERFPAMFIVLVMSAVILGALVFFIFLRPERAVPPFEAVLDRLVPREAPIRQVEALDLNVGRVTEHPVFETLRSFGPLPLRIPATGNANPFF
jgi:hypothetical protein